MSPQAQSRYTTQLAAGGAVLAEVRGQHALSVGQGLEGLLLLDELSGLPGYYQVRAF